MNELYDVLELMGNYLLFTDALALTIISVICYKDNQIRTTLLALLTTVVITGFMTAYTPSLLLFSEENQQYKAFNRFVWYMGFTGLNLLIMWVIFKLHVKFQVAYGVVAKSYLLSFMVLSQLQLIQYIELLIWGNNSFISYYQLGVISINVGSSLVAFIFTLLICLSRYRINRGKKGLAWNY